MTNEPADDQMEFELEVDSHIPVSSETVIKAMSIIILTGDKDKDYELLSKFLEPQTEDEKRIIRDTLENNYHL
jgi:xanthine/CO dehydrogenase XdhC/CoxF family maturation factor